MSAWDGRPQNPERDGAHRITFIGSERMWLWVASREWWIDHLGRAVSPLQIAETRLSGYGEPLFTQAEHAAAVQAERAACAALAIERGAWAANDLDSGHMVDRFRAEGRMDMAGEIAAAIRARGDTSALAAAVEAARREEREACAVMLEAEVVRIDALALGLAAKPPEETKPNHIERLNVTLACAMKVKECVKAIRARSEGNGDA